MKFRILVQMPSGRESWEVLDKEVGEANIIRGYGKQPTFTGDITKYGEEIVAWFNEGEGEDTKRHRKFIRAEMLPNPPAESEKPAKKIKYLYDDAFKFESPGIAQTTHYIRAWKGEGRGRNAELVVQVWHGKTKPEGEPDGDWAMPYVLGVPNCIRQAVAQTTPAAKV